jgi:sugar O-acyltransferase (sialic acid O-acetyltransferase NeuD family)
MIIIGAKGFAKEVLCELLNFLGSSKKNIIFFDDVNTVADKVIFDDYEILSSKEEAKEYMASSRDNEFILGLGGPRNRQELYHEFKAMGGNPFTLISKNSTIGPFYNQIGKGSFIGSGVVITAEVDIGIGSLINLNSTIGHNTVIGDFTEICPGVNISGNVKIGRNTFIGTGANILPEITIGQNVIIGAGCLVNKDIPDKALVYGVPGKIIRIND